MDCFPVALTDDYYWAYIDNEPITLDGTLYDVIGVYKGRIAVVERTCIPTYNQSVIGSAMEENEVDSW